jgi:hypothetical protein
MLLLVVTHRIRPAANKTMQEEIARTAKGLAGLAAIAIDEANTCTVLRTGAVHCTPPSVRFAGSSAVRPALQPYRPESAVSSEAG